MIELNQLATLRGADVYDSKGEKIGSVGQVYTGGATGQPEWASVNTGLFGLKETLVPLHGARVEGDRLVVDVDKDTANGAPNIDSETDEPLSSDEVGQLYEYYHVSWDRSAGSGTAAGGDTATAGTARQASGDDAMTLSEERLNVGTERQEVGRARLRKYVVTEQVQQTVPVRREEVRLEREPITDANRGEAYSGPEISEAEHEVTLHEERPVVTTETVATERVRLTKDVVDDQQTVSADVRREEVETDLPGDSRSR